MTRSTLAALAALVVVVGVVGGVAFSRRPVAPTVYVAGAEGRETVAVAFGAVVDLRVAVTEARYLYVFDRVGLDRPVLIWESPDGAPFEPGEYAAEGEFGRRPGLHEVIAVASAELQPQARSWATVDAIRACSGCSWSSVSVVVAEASDAGLALPVGTGQ